MKFLKDRMTQSLAEKRTALARAVRRVPATLGSQMINLGLRMGGGGENAFIGRMADKILVDDLKKRFDNGKNITQGPLC